MIFGACIQKPEPKMTETNFAVASTWGILPGNVSGEKVQEVFNVLNKAGGGLLVLDKPGVYIFDSVMIDPGNSQFFAENTDVAIQNLRLKIPPRILFKKH